MQCEVWVLTLGDVSFLHLPPRFDVAGITIDKAAPDWLPSGAWEAGEIVIGFDESWGERYWAVAGSADWSKER